MSEDPKKSSGKEGVVGVLRSLWIDLLGVDPDDDPDFMRAGGSSLLLMEFQLRFYKQRRILLDLDSLEYPINFDAMVALAREASGESSEEASDKPDSPTAIIEVIDSHWPDIGDPLGLASEGAVSSEMPRSLTAQVRESARIHPDAIAVREGESVITYAELVEAGDRLARVVMRHRVKPGGIVMIRHEPGIDYCIAVLGTITARCFAAPVHPDNPEARVTQIAGIADPIAVIGGDIAGYETPSIQVERSSDARDSDQRSMDLPETTVDDPCYVLFTSGSTGRPKGVRMHQLPVANLAKFESERVPPSVRHRTGQLAPLGFDVVFQEMFGTWWGGDELVVVPSRVRKDPARLLRFLAEQGISRIHCVPFHLRAIARTSIAIGLPLIELKEAVVGGERLLIDEDVRDFARNSECFNLVNQLGAAETIQYTSADLGDDPEKWVEHPEVGGPIPGVAIRIVSETRERVSSGIEGEIEVGGVAPGLGYLGTADDQQNFERDETGRWYRTGDLGVQRSDGTIEFRGRRDHRVKIRGFRIELEEIEHVLRAVPGIAEGLVIPVEGLRRERQLLAVVGAEDGLEPSFIRRELADRLPSWMVPQHLRIVDSIPLSGNGKIDRIAASNRFRSEAALIQSSS